MAPEPLRPGGWRHWVGTALMAAAVVLLVNRLVSPPPESELAAYVIGYYAGGLAFLFVGWWLRTRTKRD